MYFPVLGVGIQSARIPLRFFIEQLNNGYRLVLTGIDKKIDQ